MRLIKNHGIDVKTDYEKTIATAEKQKLTTKKQNPHLKKTKTDHDKTKATAEKKTKTGYEKTKATAEEAKTDDEKAIATIGKNKNELHTIKN